METRKERVSEGEKDRKPEWEWECDQREEEWSERGREALSEFEEDEEMDWERRRRERRKPGV